MVQGISIRKSKQRIEGTGSTETPSATHEKGEERCRE
jgi:hypothetical protein